MERILTFSFFCRQCFLNDYPILRSAPGNSYFWRTTICGDNPTIKELIDYEQFCGIAPEPAQPEANPDEVTVQDMKKALDNPGLGIKVIDVRSPREIGAAAISRGKPTNTRSQKWTACRCCH